MFTTTFLEQEVSFLLCSAVLPSQVTSDWVHPMDKCSGLLQHVLLPCPISDLSRKDGRCLKSELYSRPASSPKPTQVFTLRQEFGMSADNLDYEYVKGEKYGREKETEKEPRSLSECVCSYVGSHYRIAGRPLFLLWTPCVCLLRVDGKHLLDLACWKWSLGHM